MAIDCLALCLDISPLREKSEQLMISIADDKILMQRIKERQNADYLPAMQIDGTIEFKPAGGMSDIIPSSP